MGVTPENTDVVLEMQLLGLGENICEQDKEEEGTTFPLPLNSSLFDSLVVSAFSLGFLFSVPFRRHCLLELALSLPPPPPPPSFCVLLNPHPQQLRCGPVPLAEVSASGMAASV